MASEGKARAKTAGAGTPPPAPAAPPPPVTIDPSTQAMEFARVSEQLEQVTAKFEKAQKIIGRMKTQTGDDRALIAEHEETIDDLTKKLQVVSRAYQDLQLQEQTRRQIEAEAAKNAAEKTKEPA